ncbi:MAG: hypothetical protein IJ197_07220 [Bacteroidaceae bacterium]|nr:hypothetical protein [Bacteroidaceae bacterium]
MKTRKLGYHHLVLPDGSRHDMVVVEVDEEGRYLSHHPLEGEEPFVEWVGGEFRIMNDKRCNYGMDS